jgi:hypothetical protein
MIEFRLCFCAAIAVKIKQGRHVQAVIFICGPLGIAYHKIISFRILLAAKVLAVIWACACRQLYMPIYLSRAAERKHSNFKHLSVLKCFNIHENNNYYYHFNFSDYDYYAIVCV